MTGLILPLFIYATGLVVLAAGVSFGYVFFHGESGDQDDGLDASVPYSGRQRLLWLVGIFAPVTLAITTAVGLSWAQQRTAENISDVERRFPDSSSIKFERFELPDPALMRGDALLEHELIGVRFLFGWYDGQRFANIKIRPGEFESFLHALQRGAPLKLWGPLRKRTPSGKPVHLFISEGSRANMVELFRHPSILWMRFTGFWLVTVAVPGLVVLFTLMSLVVLGLHRREEADRKALATILGAARTAGTALPSIEVELRAASSWLRVWAFRPFLHHARADDGRLLRVDCAPSGSESRARLLETAPGVFRLLPAAKVAAENGDIGIAA